ncbi:MAG TPA: SAM-dependent methyltransferase [Polyangiaceae bacterium]|jgi:predicted methyltransferase
MVQGVRAALLAAIVVCSHGCASTPAPAPAPTPTPTPTHAPAPTPTHVTVSPDPAFRDLLAAPDRSPADRALDQGRRAAELFTFAGVKPGQHVAEIGSWEGYTAELLARAVAPDGVVYAQDPPEFDKFTHATWEERAKRPPFARIVRVARSFEDPVPPGTPPLDIVFSVLFYHDTVWLGVDRARMNGAIFHALKPGGVLVLADHSARAGDATQVAKSLHRIEESVVIDELQRAGFVLDAEADFLRHPEDPRDWSASDEAPPAKRGTSDRFVLRFRRP